MEFAMTCMEFPRVAIILINYKDYAARFLIACRDSIRQLEYRADRMRVYIVDNATSGETARFLKRTFPEATVIPEEYNVGWGAGNNRAITRAQADGCGDFVFLNMDTMVDPLWLTELVSAAYSDNTIGVAQSKIYVHPPRPDGTYYINSLGNRFHYLGFGFCAGGNQPDDPSVNTITDINYASGTAMYVKGEVLDRVGLFEENFFMYHDDTELCFKAKQAGYRVVLAPRSVVYHAHEFSRSIKQYYYMERNRFLTLYYFYRLPTLLLIAPMFLAMECGQLIFAFRNGYVLTRLRVYVYFVHPLHLIHAWRRRRAIQHARTEKYDRDFVRDFADTIEFQEVDNALLRRVGNPLMRAYWQLVKKMIVW